MTIDLDICVDDYLMSNYEIEKKERGERQIGVYYASDVYRCLRAVYWDYIDPLPPTLEQLRFFEIGNVMHNWALDVLRKQRILVRYEDETFFEFKTEQGNVLSLIGRSDAVIRDEHEETIEIKTVKYLPKEPYQHHIEQLNIYLIAAQMWKGRIWYVERNSLRTKTFFINSNDELFERSLDRFAKLDSYLVSKTLPPAEALIKNHLWQCKNCRYFQRCKKDLEFLTFEEGEKK